MITKEDFAYFHKIKKDAVLIQHQLISLKSKEARFLVQKPATLGNGIHEFPLDQQDHYHNYFDDTLHVDTSNAPAVVDTPVDYDNKSVSDYPESRVTVMPTTQFSHDEETGSFGIDVEQDGITEAARVSQLATVSSGTNLKLTVKGQSYLAAGDVINFNILSVENKVVSDGALDPQYAGRYVISKIRHRITNDDYIQVLECVKDSVFNAYATDSEEYYQGHPHLVENVRGQDINQYDDLDEDLEKGRPIRL